MGRTGQDIMPYCIYYYLLLQLPTTTPLLLYSLTLTTTTFLIGWFYYPLCYSPYYYRFLIPFVFYYDNLSNATLCVHLCAPALTGCCCCCVGGVHAPHYWVVIYSPLQFPAYISLKEGPTSVAALRGITHTHVMLPRFDTFIPRPLFLLIPPTLTRVAALCRGNPTHARRASLHRCYYLMPVICIDIYHRFVLVTARARAHHPARCWLLPLFHALCFMPDACGTLLLFFCGIHRYFITHIVPVLPLFNSVSLHLFPLHYCTCLYLLRTVLTYLPDGYLLLHCTTRVFDYLPTLPLLPTLLYDFILFLALVCSALLCYRDTMARTYALRAP